jgi:hypothetical protein
MKRVIIHTIMFCFLIVSATPALAVDTSIDASKSKSTSKETGRSEKQSKEKRRSEGTKKATNKSTSQDSTTAETQSSSGQAGRSSGARVEVELSTIFLDKIAELENKSAPFSLCKIVTSPKLPADFGITMEIEPGVYSPIRAQRLQLAAQSNKPVSDFTKDDQVRDYHNCLVQYGAVMGQAYFLFNSYLDQLRAAPKKGKNGTATINGIGYEDLVLVANVALENAAKDITNPTIRSRVERTMRDTRPCRFDKSADNIQCGSSAIALTNPPKLMIEGVKWYDGGVTVAGISAKYSVANDWSYTDAYNKQRSNSQSVRTSEDESTYVEKSISEGKAVEAVKSMREAVQETKSGKISQKISTKEKGKLGIF